MKYIISCKLLNCLDLNEFMAEFDEFMAEFVFEYYMIVNVE